jgi:hypothetical protein
MSIRLFTFGLSVMHRYVRDSSLQCQQMKIVKGALWTAPGSTKPWYASVRLRRILPAISVWLLQPYPECSKETAK